MLHVVYSSHLRTLEKCRKQSPAARAFYISLVFSNACRVFIITVQYTAYASLFVKENNYMKMLIYIAILLYMLLSIVMLYVVLHYIRHCKSLVFQ